jgi:hypothetical protein
MNREAMAVSVGNNFDEYEEYGLSVWSEIGLTAQQIHAKYLQRYPRARASTAGKIRALGYELKPTHGPGHYDIIFLDEPNDTDWDKLDKAFDIALRYP